MSRMPSTSIGTRSVDALARAPRSRPRRAAGCRPAAGSARARRARASGTGSSRRASTRGGTSADEVFVAQVLDARAAGRRHRLGDDRARELALGDLGREPLRRALGEAQRRRRARRWRISATSAGTSERLTVPTTPSVACPVSRPWSIERSLCSASISLRMRAGPVEHPHAELGRHGAPAAPDEQLHAELGLELADVLGDVRLHRVQPVGGGGERAFLGDREQRLELAEVHCSSGPLPEPIRPACVDASLSTIDRIVSTPLTDGLVIGFTRWYGDELGEPASPRRLPGSVPSSPRSRLARRRSPWPPKRSPT